MSARLAAVARAAAWERVHAGVRLSAVDVAAVVALVVLGLDGAR